MRNLLLLALSGCVFIGEGARDGRLDEYDQDADGHYDQAYGGDDCDDADAGLNPSAEEVCDAVDNDCDGAIDEGLDGVWYADADGDGYGDPGAATIACEPGGALVDNADDCDDTNGAVSPDASEACNGIDDDCSGGADDALLGLWFADADGDGYGDPTAPTLACAPGDALVDNAGDCDDDDAAVNPDAEDVCNGKDDDCSGGADEGLADLWYADADADGFGDPNEVVFTCDPGAGFVRKGGDCDDSDNRVRPDAAEDCDGEDDDCDGTIDEGLGGILYADGDGDGYGDPAEPIDGCSGAGGVANALDCNDGDPKVHAGAAETCNNKDEDCDGQIDEGLGDTWYKDADGDGFGDADAPVVNCTGGSGLVSNDDDCDDDDATVKPGATETCDEVDEDCDGKVDDGVTTGATWFKDADGDGFGAATGSITACQAPPGYVSRAGDCDDTKKAVSPDATESCNGVDDDCDGAKDEVTADGRSC